MLYHLGLAIAADKYFGIDAFAIPFAFGGAAGVNFFFVLSGFIILTAHRDELFQPGRLPGYVRKRIVRVYPPYWIIFVGVFVIALASPSLRASVPHDVVTILKSLLLVPQDPKLVGGLGSPVIVVAWSLQYEVLFYALFGLLFLRRWLVAVAGLALLATCLAVWQFSDGSMPLQYLSSADMTLFLMGLGVGLVARSVAPPWHRVALVAGALIFVSIIADSAFGINVLARHKVLLYGAAGAMIVLGLTAAERSGKVLLGGPRMTLLGDASYALYLIHYPLISALCKLAMLARLNSLGVIGALIAYVMILSACIAAALLFHLRIERPLAVRLSGNRSGGQRTSRTTSTTS